MAQFSLEVLLEVTVDATDRSHAEEVLDGIMAEVEAHDDALNVNYRVTEVEELEKDDDED